MWRAWQIRKRVPSGSFQNEKLQRISWFQTDHFDSKTSTPQTFRWTHSKVSVEACLCQTVMDYFSQKHKASIFCIQDFISITLAGLGFRRQTRKKKWFSSKTWKKNKPLTFRHDTFVVSVKSPTMPLWRPRFYSVLAVLLRHRRYVW